MSTGYHTLTEKEKQTLRLIVRGHDAKSAAQHFGLSVHTVNERLRDARRKLEVSSSREAARLLLDREGEDPEKLGDKQIGEVSIPKTVTIGDTDSVSMRPSGVGSRNVWLTIGVVLMTLVLAILVLAAPPQSVPSHVSTTASETTAVSTAREWLRLHDEGRWRETYEATAQSFRKLNTLKIWSETAQAVRPALGKTISRVLISQEAVPAPPAGVQVVKFRTSFANKADAVETVSLAREDGAWKVVGIYID